MPDDLDDAGDLAIPDGPRVAEGVIWLFAFFVLNYLALGVAMDVHGAGFDDCERMPTASERTTMKLIALSAVLAPAGLALWRLRGWSRVAALGAVAFSAVIWYFLTNSSQRC